MPHASYLTGKRKETHLSLSPRPFLCKCFTGHFPLERYVWKPRWMDPDASRTGPMLLELELSWISVKKKQKLDCDQGSRRSFKWLEMMCVLHRQSHASPLTGCDGLTTLALIQGDTQPSNLLSAQFQWTMEFRACRYTTLLSALRLAARLMRLRLPTGEPNGVKTKVLLWTNNPSLHYHTERHWLLSNTPALTRKCISIATARFLRMQTGECCEDFNNVDDNIRVG